MSTLRFDAAVAIAGLLSYIGLFGYIFWQQGTSGKSLDRSRRGASIAEGHFETIDHLQEDARPAGGQLRDRVWYGGSSWRKTTRRCSVSGRGSVRSTISSSLALALHPKISPRLWEGWCHRLPGLKHAPFWEAPDVFDELLGKFIDDIAPG
jgi:hypothetical protein